MEFTLGLVDKLSGPAAGMSSALGKLSDTFSSTGALSTKMGDTFGKGAAALGPFVAAAAATVGVLTALAAAAAAVVIGGSKLALEMSEARAQLVTTFDALGGGVGQGEKTIAMLDSLRASTGQTRTALAGWAQTLQAAGTRDLPTLQARLTAVSSSFALMGAQGQQASDKVVKLFTKVDEAGQLGKKLQLSGKELQGIGVDAADIAKQLGIPVEKMNAELKSGQLNAKKFGDALTQALTEKGKGPLERFSNSFSSLSDRFKESLGQLFEGVDPGPFVEGLKSVASVFDQSTASGKAMKLLITTAFNGILSVASKVFPYIKAFLEGLVIGALKAYIAFKPVIKAIGDMFGGPPSGGLIKAIAGVAEALVTPLVIMGKIIATAIQVAVAIKGAFDQAAVVIHNASSAVGDFINGLVQGIENGAGLVLEAVKNLGKSMLNGLKSALGISSPSKEMMKLGGFSAEGFGAGISKASPKAMAPMRSLAAGAMGAAGKGGAGAGKGGSSATTVHFHEGAIKIDGAGKSAQEISLETLSLAFEQLRRAQGL